MKINFNAETARVIFSFDLMERHESATFSAAIGKIKPGPEGKKVKMIDFGNHTYHASVKDIQRIRVALKNRDIKMKMTSAYEEFARRCLVPAEKITIDWYPSFCVFKGGPIPFGLIIDKTSHFTKAAMQTHSYKRGRWDGMIHSVNFQTGRFPSGLLERFVNCLVAAGMPYEINRKFEFVEPYLNLNPVFPFTPSDDQYRAVDVLDKANAGIGKCPTGFGKTSFVAAALIAKKGVRSMFLANQRILIGDAKNDFENAFVNDTHIRIGMIGDGNYDPADITVASIQGIVAALKPLTFSERKKLEEKIKVAEETLERYPDDPKFKTMLTKAKKSYEKAKVREARREDLEKFLKTVDLFVVDEAQVLGTDMWNVFLDACPAPYRYTLSATVTRTDGGGVLIVAATGEIRFESSAAEQIEKKRLSEFKAKFKVFDHGLPSGKADKLEISYKQAYDLFITHNELRNIHLVDKAIEWAKDYSVLCLVTFQEHGEIIQELFEQRGLSRDYFRYIDGKTKKKQREDDIQDFRDSKFPILIGTSIFDVGFNAKNASRIVRFNAGGSEVREPQRAGRTVRMRDDGSHGESYDIKDIKVPFFERQASKRIALLEEEFGESRVEILNGTIHGVTNFANLRDVVSELKEEDAKERTLQVLDEIQGIQRHDEAVDKSIEGQIDAFGLDNLQNEGLSLEDLFGPSK